jgi:hypothetical protein
VDEDRVQARLDRIDALERTGAASAELLAELRSLLREAGSPARVGPADDEVAKEVVGRLRTARARDIIGM